MIDFSAIGAIFIVVALAVAVFSTQFGQTACVMFFKYLHRRQGVTAKDHGDLSPSVVFEPGIAFGVWAWLAGVVSWPYRWWRGFQTRIDETPAFGRWEDRE